MRRYPGPWGICQRSGRRMPLDKLVRDGQTKLLVDPRWYDQKHPQETPARVREEIAVPNASPENFTDPYYEVDGGIIVNFPQFNSQTTYFESTVSIVYRLGDFAVAENRAILGVNPDGSPIDVPAGVRTFVSGPEYKVGVSL